MTHASPLRGNGEKGQTERTCRLCFHLSAGDSVRGQSIQTYLKDLKLNPVWD